MRFTDAHAGSSVCTPSRYSILTGRYAWRSRLKEGIVWEWDAPLIEPDRTTVAGLLQTNGYRTTCLGKLHLGWDWPTLDGRHPNETLPFGVLDGDRRGYGENIDYAGRIGGGPVDRGFDTYFGTDVPNFPPYTWFENDRLVEFPSAEKPDDEGVGEDSVSMLPLLQGETDRPTRDCIIHHSALGKFAIREADWVYIDAPSGNDKHEPECFKKERGYCPHGHPGELFN